MWSKIPRQYRRIVCICGFLAILSLIYHAGFSEKMTCKDIQHPCNKVSIREGRQFPEEVKTKLQDEERRTGVIFRRGIAEDDSSRMLKNSGQSRQDKEKINIPNKKRKEIVKSSNKIKNKIIQSKSSISSTKRTITLSDEIRNHEVTSVYIQIKEADSPIAGDFECDATIVPNCCAITVEDSHEAKHICEGFGNQCKGFVMSTISSSNKDSFEYVMYIKNQLNETMANYLTDFFIKVDYLDQLRWKEDQR